MKSSLFRVGGFLSVFCALLFGGALLALGVTEEVPIGTLDGVTVRTQDGRAIQRAVVVLSPVFTIPDRDGKAWTTRSGEDGTFAFRNIPAGKYRVEAYSQAHNLEKQIVEVGEGKATHVDLELAPNAPYLDIYSSQKVWSPTQEPSIQARGFGPEGSISITLFQVKFDSILAKRSAEAVLSPLSSWNDSANPEASPDLVEARRLDWAIRSRDGEGIFDERISLPALPEGLYYVRLSIGAVKRVSWLLVTKIALVTKSGGREVLAYVMDIESGKPIPGAAVAVTTSAGLKPVGKTDGNGLCRFVRPAAAKDENEEEDSENVAVVATVGSSRAVTSYYSYFDPSAKPTTIWFYTDRPIYRPGDEIQFKGVARVMSADDYLLPPKGNAEIEVKDPYESTLSRLTLPVGPSGSFHGSFRVPTEIVGTYEVITRFNGVESSSWVNVAAYRKPEFKITVTPEKPFYVRGDVVRMKVLCEYYFGGPVAGATLDVGIFRAPVWDSYDPDSDETEEYESDYAGDFVENLEGLTTDENGVCILEFDTRKDAAEPYAFNDQWLTFEVYATETGDKAFEGKGRVKVTRGTLALSGEIESYISAPGVPLKSTFTVTANDTGKPVAGSEIVVEAGFEQWERNRSRFVRESLETVRTDAQGVATVTSTPQGRGSYVVRGTIRDERGNRIAFENFAWVFSDGGASFSGPAPNLQVVLDKKQYRLGDTAKAMIRTSKPGGSALVTVESDKVLWAQVVPLTETGATLSIPVVKAFSPNARVMAAYVVKKSFAEAGRMLAVDLVQKKLQVEVKPNVQIVEPGGSVSYTITTKDDAGNPVSAEVSLGVVDESIYAIAEDTNDPLKVFYPRRYHTVRTAYSFPEIYLDGGDKSEVNVDIRKKFLDTAFWDPMIETDARGEAVVTVPLPDNLTAWRATAVAITAETQVGKARTEVKARKNLMIRISPPSYLVQGDRVRMPATIHNDTDTDGEFDVRLTTKGVDLEGAAQQKVRVAAGSTQTVTWFLNAQAPGNAEIIATVTGSGASDGMQLTLPIATHGRERRTFDAGTLRDQANLSVVRLPGTAEGQVTLSVTPTLAGAVLGSLDELVDYPYGCVEQTMSRFMPAMIVGKALKDLGLSRPELEQKIPEIARRSQNRLITMQHDDGGFGWWENDRSEPDMTALVLEGLWRAERAGFRADPFVIQRALSWSKQRLARSEKPDASELERYPYLATQRESDEIYLAYAVLLRENAPDAIGRLRRANPKLLDTEGWAWVALAAQAVAKRDPGNAVLVTEMGNMRENAIAKLLGTMTTEGGYAFWTGGWGVETTARALDALVNLREFVGPRYSEIVPKVLRYLLEKRRGSMWMSTRDTAQTVAAAVSYLNATKELGTSYALDIKLNGRMLKTVAVDLKTMVSASLPVTVPITELQEGDNTIEIVKRGGGLCYYSLEVKQTPSEARIGHLVNGSGLRVDHAFYALAAKRMEDGTLRLKPSAQPVTTALSGQTLRGLITITSDRPLEYVLVEVPTPSNLRVVENDSPDEWSWWYSDMQVLDDKIAFFMRYVPQGASTVEYHVRAEAPGTASALPATAYAMYNDTRRGSSAALQIEVKPR
ncbi:MAG TPA: alpha-2-macroglobulin family protein [Fimbriimonadaceae bacterium]|nr:alpha-2-macroglobulin family protein [Fimbriimonadaceae bacterium]